jgi:uncharacterized membrane protein YeaQ/YmgE (transglycosylase-associated protein family)
VELVIVLVVLAIVGTGIGALARLVLPGKDPMPLWVMVGIGVVSAVVGGLIGYAILKTVGAILLAVGGAVGLVYGYRRWKRRGKKETPAAAAPAAPVQPAAPVTQPASAPSPPPVQTTPPAPAPAPTPVATPVAEKEDKFCSQCGTKFTSDERFCTNCGAQRD